MPAIFRISILVDAEDQHLVDKYTWYADSFGYPSTHVDGKLVRLHKLIFPYYKLCDHRDRNPLNNRRLNLREATSQQNIFNKGPTKTNVTGYKGVSLHKASQLYRAYITINRHQIHLGYHKTVLEAALVYNEAAKKYHGEFAYLNVLGESV